MTVGETRRDRVTQYYKIRSLSATNNLSAQRICHPTPEYTAKEESNEHNLKNNNIVAIRTSCCIVQDNYCNADRGNESLFYFRQSPLALHNGREYC